MCVSRLAVNITGIAAVQYRAVLFIGVSLWKQFAKQLSAVGYYSRRADIVPFGDARFILYVGVLQ